MITFLISNKDLRVQSHKALLYKPILSRSQGGILSTVDPKETVPVALVVVVVVVSSYVVRVRREKESTQLIQL